MKCLIVDDIQVVGNAINIELNGNSIESFYYQYKVTEGYNYNIGKIVELIIDNNITFLVIDRGFSQVSETENKLYFSSTIANQLADVVLVGDQSAKIDGVFKLLADSNYFLQKLFIYTYNPFDFLIENKISQLRPFISYFTKNNKTEDFQFLFIETSSIFKRPANSEIYPDQFNNHPNNLLNQSSSEKKMIGSVSSFNEYGSLISKMVIDILQNKSGSIFSFTNLNNLSFNSYIKSVNYSQFSNNFGLSSFKIGSVSFTAEINNKVNYLVDIPYKEYFGELNTELIENDLTSIFDSLKNSKYSVADGCGYKYNYDKNGKKFELYHISKKGENSLFLNWLPYLHSGVFHDPSAWKIKTIEELTTNNNHLNLIFFYKKFNKENVSGFLNFTLISETSQVEYNDNIRNEILSYYVPIIESKLSELLLPHFTQSIIRQATRAAISQVMARNMSHNIGSHVLSRFTSPDDIQRFIEGEEKNNTYSPLFKEI